MTQPPITTWAQKQNSFQKRTAGNKQLWKQSLCILSSTSFDLFSFLGTQTLLKGQLCSARNEDSIQSVQSKDFDFIAIRNRGTREAACFVHTPMRLWGSRTLLTCCWKLALTTGEESLRTEQCTRDSVADTKGGRQQRILGIWIVNCAWGILELLTHETKLREHI